LEQQDFYLLIARHFNAQTTTEEETFLTDWLQQSAENRETFSVLQEIWTTAETVSDNEVVAAGLKNVKYKIAASGRRVRYIAAAAMIAVMVISCALLFYRPGNNYIEQTSLAGQVLHLHLPDGTLVHLAPKSTIRYSKEAGREIILKGEAFFEVNKDAHHPFSVRAGKLSVNVLGTRFNVSDTAVSLVDGKVQVTVDEKAYTLTPGRQLCYKNGHYYEQAYDVDDVTGWASALLVFRNESFASAAAKIEKMYDVKIIFSDPVIATHRLFAKFSNKPLTYVLDVIKASDNLDYTIKGKNVYISGIK
jgi:ferric-dicitrate binding protein FerR (iron transport regulator)